MIEKITAARAVWFVLFTSYYSYPIKQPLFISSELLSYSSNSLV